jgi:hypothetical protein
MAKRIALKDSISVDGQDLSNLSRAWSFTSEHEQVDMSGFNATGFSEFLAGPTTQQVTIEFYGSYGSSEVHETIYPIHKDRDTVALAITVDGLSDSPGPTLSGNVQVNTYNPGATRGEAETFEVTFAAADEDGLTFAAAS